MPQHFLDGFAIYDVTGRVHGYVWRSLLSARWWTWQAELKWKRMVCRVLGHCYVITIRLHAPQQSWCSRCDWYE